MSYIYAAVAVAYIHIFRKISSSPITLPYYCIYISYIHVCVNIYIASHTRHIYIIHVYITYVYVT